MAPGFPGVVMNLAQIVELGPEAHQFRLRPDLAYLPVLPFDPDGVKPAVVQHDDRRVPAPDPGAQHRPRDAAIEVIMILENSTGPLTSLEISKHYPKKRGQSDFRRMHSVAKLLLMMLRRRDIVRERGRPYRYSMPEKP